MTRSALDSVDLRWEGRLPATVPAPLPPGGMGWVGGTQSPAKERRGGESKERSSGAERNARPCDLQLGWVPGRRASLGRGNVLKAAWSSEASGARPPTVKRRSVPNT